MKKRLLLSFLAVIFLLAGVVVGAGFYMLSYSLTPSSNESRNIMGARRKMLAAYPELRPWMDSINACAALRDTFVRAADGDRHHAFYVPAPRPTNRVAVIVHGYTNNAYNMLNIAYIYHHGLGCNILLPDLHAAGLSDGRAIQMGWKDRVDVLQWAAVADRLFRDSTGVTRQVLHGISMGAATVMCAAGERTPSYIRCFVEDCGYTSVWDEFKHELRSSFGLPAFPLMQVTSQLCRIRYGWSFGEASPLRQVAKCRKPMLFIHGGADDYVPTPMVYELFRAKPEPKQCWIAPGAGHAKSYKLHRRKYCQMVGEFVNTFLR